MKYILKILLKNDERGAPLFIFKIMLCYRNLFPDNLLEACFRQTKTRYKERSTGVTEAPMLNGTNITTTAAAATTTVADSKSAPCHSQVCSGLLQCSDLSLMEDW